jgi:hypothetical protein
VRSATGSARREVAERQHKALSLEVARKQLIGDFEGALAAKEAELLRARAGADADAKAPTRLLRSAAAVPRWA